MCKKSKIRCGGLIFLVSLILLLLLAGNAVAQLDPAAVTDGHVYLFEGITGSQLPDGSSNSNAGIIVGDP